MTSESKTFSESWYRVANNKVSLKPHVQARRQFFRGEKWYVLQDAFNNQFFRLRPGAYDFIARLRPDRTIQQVWDECLVRSPDDAPGQEEVIRLLAQLYHANLLHYAVAADSAKLFERYKKRVRSETKSKLLGIMFARFPLVDPDVFLKRVLPIFRPFIGSLGALIWVIVVVAALKVVIDNFDTVKVQSQGILAPGNLFLLYLGLVIIKTIHEFGHALVCRRFGGEVHVMGVMLLVFTPIPYMDATSSWAFRSRFQRTLVGAAGMIFEIFVAACATFVWAYTGSGTVHSLAYNMMFIASFSTIVFNINPLLRFDGYYILSDVLDIPNLHTNGKQQLRHLVEHYLFGCKKSYSPATSLRETFWLTFFGITSGIYRIVVFTGILLFVADKFLLFGLIMAVVCCISWVLVPIGRLFQYLTNSPRLERTRKRAVFVTLGFVATLFILLGKFQYPNRFRAPGVLETEAHPSVINESPGYIAKIVVPTGSHVVQGQKLLRLRHPELDFEIAGAKAQYNQTILLKLRSISGDSTDMASINSRIEAIKKKLNYFLQRQRSLVVRANQSGMWTAPLLEEYLGMWVPRGTILGQILNQDTFQFSAIVSQQEASRLFENKIGQTEIRLKGQANLVLPVAHLNIIPAEQSMLPSAAMGWAAGGDIAVDVSDPSGLRAAESFFNVIANIKPVEGVAFFHGRSGKIRFELPPEPLLQQWYRKLRQLIQQRYQI